MPETWGRAPPGPVHISDAICLLAHLAPQNIALIWLLSWNTEIKSEEDLIAPGAKPGTIPTDYIQATGLERLELIGKMQGIDIFDMRPLDASRKGMCAIPFLFLGLILRNTLFATITTLFIDGACGEKSANRSSAANRNTREPYHRQRCR